MAIARPLRHVKEEPEQGRADLKMLTTVELVPERDERAPGEPRPEKSLTPQQRPKAKPLGATTVIVVASVVMLGGVFVWAAFDNVTSQSNRAWESVPTGQPYYVAPDKPVIPASATGDGSSAGAMAGMAMASQTSSNATATSKVALPPMVDSIPSAKVTLSVDPPPLGGTYGSDGQIHDNFSPAYFAVPAGKTIHVTIANYDDMWHTFTAPALGLNVWIQPGGAHPSKVSFTFTAPKAGNYWWLCAIPCDSYSMSAGGYMEGEIHAVKA